MDIGKEKALFELVDFDFDTNKFIVLNNKTGIRKALTKAEYENGIEYKVIKI